MSYQIWRRKYLSDPSVIGSTIVVNRHPVRIAGVAAPGFFGATLRPSPPDFWMPLSTERFMNGANSIADQPDMHWLFVIGRIREGAKPSAIDASLKVDLQVLGVAVAVLAVSGLLATLAPARRAASIVPIRALRTE